MATELRKVSLQDRNQNLTCLSGVRNWIHEHPTTAKILKIAGLILGIGLLASIPFAIPLGMGIVGGLAVAGITAIVASLILFACRPPALPTTDPSHVDHAVMPIADLWLHLGQKNPSSVARA